MKDSDFLTTVSGQKLPQIEDQFKTFEIGAFSHEIGSSHNSSPITKSNQPLTNFSSEPFVEASSNVPNCPQCHTIHPPLGKGVTCPLAKNNDQFGNRINLDAFLKSMNHILLNTIQTKNIKDINKFTGKITVELNKFCEQYIE